jgi:arylformamidase
MKPLNFRAPITIIDLSASLDENTSVYAGDQPLRMQWLSRIPGSLYNLSALQLGPHTGTHVDAPLHFLADGAPIGGMELSLFTGEALCIDSPKREGQDVTLSDCHEADIRKGDIVLFRTGWEERSGTPLFFSGEWPGISPEAVEDLAGRGARAIGLDSPSADSPKALKAGARGHTTAARLALPVYESLVRLSAVMGTRFVFIGLPLRLTRSEASPVRAVAILGGA